MFLVRGVNALHLVSTLLHKKKNHRILLPESHVPLYVPPRTETHYVTGPLHVTSHTATRTTTCRRKLINNCYRTRCTLKFGTDLVKSGQKILRIREIARTSHCGSFSLIVGNLSSCPLVSSARTSFSHI